MSVRAWASTNASACSRTAPLPGSADTTASTRRRSGVSSWCSRWRRDAEPEAWGGGGRGVGHIFVWRGRGAQAPTNYAVRASARFCPQPLFFPPTAVLPEAWLLWLQVNGPALAELGQGVQGKEALRRGGALVRGPRQRQAQQQRQLRLDHQQQRLAARRWLQEGRQEMGRMMGWVDGSLQLLLLNSRSDHSKGGSRILPRGFFTPA